MAASFSTLGGVNKGTSFLEEISVVILGFFLAEYLLVMTGCWWLFQQVKKTPKARDAFLSGIVLCVATILCGIFTSVAHIRLAFDIFACQWVRSDLPQREFSLTFLIDIHPRWNC
jgi:succinate dehydrogenase/fumarate reductase cytochrome b subunit